MNSYNTEILLQDFVENKKLDEKATRDGFGTAIVDLARTNTNIVVLNANLESSLRLTEFSEKFPQRSIQIGVAEQNMANIATGLALYGKIPLICSFAAFSPAINFEQIRVAAYSEANIKIVSSHYGLNIGPDGVSAQMTEDISLLGAIPNMTIITPADANQTVSALKAAIMHSGPVYLRLTRAEFPVFMKKNAPFKIGKADTLKQGSDITIIATGSMVFTALEAARELENHHVSARVLNMHTVKPLDVPAVMTAARETGHIITLEEHQIHGGLGSAVSEIVSQTTPVPMSIIGIPNVWGESGTMEELYISRGLTVANVVSQARKLLLRMH